MINTQSSSNSSNLKKKYDLEEMTIEFAKEAINLIKELPQDIISKPLIIQLTRSASSIGANYAEAEEANSKKDFINKIAIAKKETRETKYWLTIITHALPESKEKARKLWKEAHELNLIFAAIIRSANKGKSN